jgi:hypothetical protein
MSQDPGLLPRTTCVSPSPHGGQSSLAIVTYVLSAPEQKVGPVTPRTSTPGPEEQSTNTEQVPFGYLDPLTPPCLGASRGHPDP